MPSRTSFTIRTSSDSHSFISPTSSSSPTKSGRNSFLHVVPEILDNMDNARASGIYDAGALESYRSTLTSPSSFSTPHKSYSTNSTLSSSSSSTPPPISPSTPSLSSPNLNSILLTPPPSTLSPPPLLLPWPTSPSTPLTLTLPTHTSHPTHITYTLHLTTSLKTYTLKKRYTDFLTLSTSLNSTRDLPAKVLNEEDVRTILTGI
ncbi:hypothetical protein TrVE_jg12469 [Triparma verrucosa]|uniref:PX domain-containing protein n=1 Tax=Triparma verrucosa TaxID=1606542 RepID=A0A9W7ENP9_9STRA|nr:hypothetical protein TrVE_jg12469 [Triparma verrucosa]